MSNSFKRFLSLALALMMVISMMPTTAFATDGEGTQPDAVVEDIIPEASSEPEEEPSETTEPEEEPSVDVCTHENQTTTTVDATCEADGSVTVTCDDCGEVLSEEAIPAGHSYVDGICENCGETDPNAVAQIDEGETPTEGYMLYIYNADGTVGYTINGTKSISAFSVKSAIEDARVFVNNAFMFGITTPATYVVEMYEDSIEDESFEIGSDVTINGNGHKIVCEEGVVVTNNGTLNDATIEMLEKETAYVAMIGEQGYETLQAAIDAAAEGSTITLVAGATISEGTIKLPATMKRITINGAEGASIKDTTIMAADGNNFSYVGLTFDGVVFDNSRLVFTGWRNGEEVIEDLTITNCVFKNLYDTTNNAAVHINKDVTEPVKNFTFTNNVIDGATGGSKSGIYSVNTGKVIITGNTFNNIVFRPALVQLADCDGLKDEVVVSNNKISNTTRLQIYGSEEGPDEGPWTPSGTDTLSIDITDNIFQNISGQYICTWGINGDTDIAENYYDEDISGRIYWNNVSPTSEAELAELGVYPIYKELNDDGTINTESAYKPVVSNLVEVDTYEELLAALEKDNAKVKLIADITATATQSSGYGKAGIVLDAGDVLDGHGHKLTINGAGGTWDCAIAMRGGEVKNLTISGAMRGVFMPGANGNVVIDNCEFAGVIYTFNSDAGSKNHTVTIKNTTLNGWTSFSAVHKAVVFENCSFGAGSGYAFCRPYQATTFTDCDFAEGYKLDTTYTAENTLAFNECTYNGAELSAENNAMFFNGGSVVIDNVTTDVTQYTVKIGEQGYATLADALAAAKTMTGDVVVEIYDKVTLADAFSGSYDSIKFVGEDDDAEIYMDVQGCIYATGEKVAFEDLKLSKVAGGYVADAGFMNLAFGIYAATEVTYTDCTFLNGAYASSGKVTFTDCTFYRSHDRYGLWAYGNVDAVVDGCTFADIRGIKMYDEGKEGVAALTVKNTDFSAVNNKPAIVLTYGESVTLENNTYSSTGVFELDLDGAPNGTPVTSDVAPTCINDNGACGVLVDGKIYTTVAQAAEVATSGSKVTLLHNSAETVELAEGVVLDKNGFEAAGVTVKVAAIAKIGDETYATLAAAVSAAQDGETVVVLKDIALGTDSVTVKGKKLTIDLNGHNITGSGYRVVTVDLLRVNNTDKKGVLTLTGNGTVENTGTNSGNSYAVYVGGSSELIVKTGATAKSTNGYAVAMFPMGAGRVSALTVDGGTITGKYGVTGNGTLIETSTVINVNSGAIIGTDVAIYQPQPGVVNIAGGTITGGTEAAIAMRRGTLNVSGGTVTGLVDVLGDYNAVTASFSGGTLTGELKVASGNTVSITGGTFSNDVSEFCAEGYKAEQNADGTYGVVAKPVAKVGNTEYSSINEAIAAWTNNTTLTLLADVTLSDVITLKSTEHHILNLGTYTMTAASGKNAFVIQACGTGSAERSTLTINADATNPGGINAGNKSIVYYKYADGGISAEDRPIIKINGGVFTGTTSTWGTAGIYTIGTAARKCATVNITGGTFNCSINGSTKSKLLISGGTFNYSVGSQGDSTALRLISGGKFKTFGFMTADYNNTKFWFGTSMGNSNVGVYVDDNGYIVVGGPVITEAGNTFEASANYSGANSLLQYSSAATNGLYYTSVEEAFADNNKTTGSVTVYVDKLDMTGISYKGTIVIPAKGEEHVITFAEGTTPAWKVQLDVGASLTAPEGLTVTTVEGYRVAYANGVYTVVPDKITVMNKAELQAAIANAVDGDTIILGADIDYGTDQLAIVKAITLDLGGKTLTTRNAYGGMSLKNNPTIKNGTIVHASNTAAIKAWNVKSFENLTIDVQGKGDAGKTIGGIVVQSGTTVRIGTIKNVTIEGSALTNGIETYNCGDATENVIGSMNNVTINANGTGMLISAPCGTATGCSISGGVSGIEIWIKGNYSATLKLVDCDVSGGEQAVYAHDEFSSNPDIVNNGTLELTADDATTFASENNAPLTLTIARAENVEDALFDEIIAECEAMIGDTYYATLQDAIDAAQVGETVTVIADIALTETVTVPAGKTVILDLNGYTVSAHIAEQLTKSFAMINNRGTLTVTDKKAGKLSVSYTGASFGYGIGLYTISNEGGTVNVEGGTIENLTTVSGSMYDAIDNNSTLGTATLNIKGGTVSCQYIAVRQFCNSTSGENIVNVTDGTVEGGNCSIWVQNPGNNAVKGKVNVEGGIFTARILMGTSAGFEAAISGGQFTVTAMNGTSEELLADGFAFAPADEDGWYTVKCLAGSGTEADPYQIGSLDDLILFRDSVNKGETKYNADGVYVALTADIDMASVNWSVNIGDDCSYTFDGIFDGKGYTLSNLTATESAQKGDGYICTGLFGAIGGNAVVKNLTIENVNINTGDFVGNNAAAVVGFAYSCTGSVENVNVIGDIQINAKNVTGTGAIVGYDFYGKLTVKDCVVDGNDGSAITGAAYVGGIIGYASNNANLTGNTVENVAITATSCAAGGIAGIMLVATATDNTIKNVTLAAGHENWQNSVASVVGTITSTVTVSGTTVDNVTTADGNAVPLVGAVHADKPTTPVAKVQAAIGNVYYTTFDKALAAAEEGATITLLDKLTGTVELAKSIALDVNGNTVEQIVLTDAAVTLTTEADKLNVTTTVADHEVKYDGTKYAVVEKSAAVLKSYAKTLIFKDIIRVSYYFDYLGDEYTSDYLLENGGILVWTSEHETYEPGTESYRVEGFTAYGTHFYATGKGIPAKEWGDMEYACAYIKNPDGSYSYSEVSAYSPKTYAYNMLGKDSTKQSLKNLLVTMLNYGAAAQLHFNYDTNNLVNKDLTAEQQAWTWDASKMITKIEVDDSKIGLSKDAGIEYYAWTLVYQGAIGMQMYNAISDELAEGAQEMGLIYWNESTYNSVDKLTADNATGKVVGMTYYTGDYYYATIEGTPAKNLGDTCFACAYVIDAEGVVHYGEVRSYSAHTYANNMINGNKKETLKNLCKTMVIYSDAAKAHFG